MSGVQFILRVFVVALLLLAPARTLRARAEAAGEPEAQQLYETAFTALVEGHYSRAYEQLDEIVARYPGTLYARFAAERKRRLEGLGLHRVGRRDIDQRGRIGTMVFGTLYSTWLGVGTAIVTGAESDRALAAGMMIGAPVGLMTAHALTGDIQMSPGQASLIKLGGLWGTWQGYGWLVAADEEGARPLTGAAMAGGLVGIASSAALTRYTDLHQGDVSLLNYAGLWGTWFGFCSSIIAGVEEGNPLLRNTLLGGDLGLLAMAALVPRIEMSPARARLINLGGLTATFVASGIVGLLALNGAFDDAKMPMGIIMAGGLAGLRIGANRTRDYDGLAGAAARRKPGALLSMHDKTVEWGWPALALRLSASTMPGGSSGPHPPSHPAELRARLVEIRF